MACRVAVWYDCVKWRRVDCRLVDEPLGKPLAFFTFLVCAFAAMVVSTSPDMMGEERPVPDEFYKSLGASISRRGVIECGSVGRLGL